MNFIFLACEITLPSSQNPLATTLNFEKEFNHQFGELQHSLEASGHTLKAVDWKAPLSEFKEADAVVIGTPWNYQDSQIEFIHQLEAIQNAGIKLFNPASMVKWNVSKTYLRELDQRGASIVPTTWVDQVTKKDVEAMFQQYDADGVVVKRQIGAGSFGQTLYKKGDEIPDCVLLDRPAMIQPFLPAIQTEGEYSFIFIDGDFSHALLKIPQQGDYRIQSTYGARERAVMPSNADIDAAKEILSYIPFDTPLYARVDLLRGNEGNLLLMEIELIEPYLYPVEGPNMSDMYAKALIKRAQN